MRSVRTCVLVALLSAPVLAQGEAIFYKFDGVGADKVVNYASHTGIAGPEGVISSTDVSAFAPGRFGAGALRGSNTGGTATYSIVETRWAPIVTGDFTVAFFLRERVAPGGATYLFGVPVALQFRCFTGGAARNGLRVTSAGSPAGSRLRGKTASLPVTPSAVRLSPPSAAKWSE